MSGPLRCYRCHERTSICGWKQVPLKGQVCDRCWSPADEVFAHLDKTTELLKEAQTHIDTAFDTLGSFVLDDRKPK
jgi:hypothetical protein